MATIREELTNDKLENIDETRCQSCLRVFLKGLRSFIAFLFSHVGLTCLVAGYAILGGIAFKAVELPQEKQIRKDVVDTKDAYVKRIADHFDDTDMQTLLDKKSTNEYVNNLLIDYQEEIYVFSKERDWDGRFEGDEFQWSFAESLLYSVTVISTIGYGNITPKTIGGRLLTIAYGIVGIPLTMLCLHNIGNLMAGCFRLLYRYACINMTYEYIKLERKRLKQRFVKRLQGRTKVLREWAKKQQSHVSSILHLSHAELNGIEERPESDATISEASQRLSSDEVHENEKERLSSDEVHENEKANDYRPKRRRHSEHIVRDVKTTTERKRFSLSSHHRGAMLHSNLAIAKGLTDIPEDETEGVTIEDMSVSKTNRENSADKDHSSATTSSISLTDFDEDERILKAKLKDTRDLVPISVCLLLVTGYIILGALIFTSWEENWNFLVAFYFCFITLTTIGFGDFVPGMGRLDNDEKRVFGALYLLFGMALLAMSFHLIQEEVRHKCRKLFVRIGLIEQKLTKLLDKYEETHLAQKT